MLETPFELVNHRGWPVRGEVRRLAGGGRRGLVVISHGFKGFKDWGHFPYLARRLADAGFTAVSFNFSGNGIGDDPQALTELDRFRANTLTTEVLDLELVLRAAGDGMLPDVPSDQERRPALLGHSRGALISTVVAGRSADPPPAVRSPVGRLVTWAGVALIRERYDESVRAGWRLRGALPVVNTRTGQVLEMGLEALDDLEAHFEEYDPLRIVARLPLPVLAVHGTADPAVPFSEAEAFCRAANPGCVRLLAIRGAGHTFGAAHPFGETTPELESAISTTIEFLARRDPAAGESFFPGPPAGETG